MDAAFLHDMEREMSTDARRVSEVMAKAHHRWHPFGAKGWNKCEKEPCNSVCVFLGDVAVVAMEIAAGPQDAV